jgi:puromycin-sensitive aminopeptidase
MIKTNKIKSVRLPNYISPISYNLNIKPDLESFTFSGNEIIKINIDREVKKITLHSKDIDIETAKYKVGKIEQFASKIIYDTKGETATFYFKNIIIKGKGELSIVFRGIINEHLRGFYKSKYVLNGEEKYLATTQFEATDARRAFPCFDEPEQKAIFEVTLIVSDKHTAISNTLPVDIKEHSAGYKIVSFAPTPKMSTYLLAFIIGDFEYVEGRTKPINSTLINKFSGPRTSEDKGPDRKNLSINSESTQVRVFTTKGKSHQAKFALEVAIKSLEFYNEYFDITYPLPTLDLIAIPDFESAAMENWGAVTFRETAILVDEENTSLSNKQWVAIVIAHELAHQWFGNLVTMKWWTDLWLNEGFASYMENLCVDHMFPDWHIWDLYVSDRYALALKLDSLSNSHPIEIKVNHPDEISEIFDMVSYAKGSAVIRMLAEYLGEDKFRDGLRHYLNKHSYKNTNTVDLWDAFEKVSLKPVKNIMKGWTSQTGYPLLTVDSKKKGAETIFQISQERFFSIRISSKENKIKSTWQVPISYESNKEIQKMLLTKTISPLIGNTIGKINKEESTFTRVRYNQEVLTNLKNEIKNKTLSVKDRLGIVRDLFALAEGGYINTIDALKFSLEYKDETEYIVWAEITGGINKISNIIRNESFKEQYNKYALSLFSPLAKNMGWAEIKGESHSQKFLRTLAISQAAYYGDKKIIKEARGLFKNSKQFPIRADIRSTIYNIVSSNGTGKEWKTFEKLYLETEMHEEKERFGRALASFKDEKLLLKTLDLSMSDNVKNQDTPFWISAVWINKYGRDLTWKFVKNNWKIIVKNYGEGGHFLSRLLFPLGSHTTLNDLADAKKFFTKNVAPGSERTLEQSYEKIESNAAWLKDDKKSIKNWLEKNY